MTPKEIENKVFSSAMRGYKREEVDQFLDEIMVEFEALRNENANLKNTISNLQADISERKRSETSVMQTLEQAKSLMTDISASAEKRAEAIMSNAHTEANRIVTDARTSVQNMRRESEVLKQGMSSFQARYKAMLTEELRRLDGEPKAEDLFAQLVADYVPDTPAAPVAPAQAVAPAAPVAPVAPVSPAAPVAPAAPAAAQEVPNFGFAPEAEVTAKEIPVAPVDTRPVEMPEVSVEPMQVDEPVETPEAREQAFDDWLDQQTSHEENSEVTIRDMSNTLSGASLEDLVKPTAVVDDKAKTIVISNPSELFGSEQ